MQNACLFSTDLNKMFTYVTQDHIFMEHDLYLIS